MTIPFTSVCTPKTPLYIRFFYPQKNIHPFTHRLFFADFQELQV